MTKIAAAGQQLAAAQVAAAKKNMTKALAGKGQKSDAESLAAALVKARKARKAWEIGNRGWVADRLAGGSGAGPKALNAMQMPPKPTGAPRIAELEKTMGETQA